MSNLSKKIRSSAIFVHAIIGSSFAAVVILSIIFRNHVPEPIIHRKTLFSICDYKVTNEWVSIHYKTVANAKVCPRMNTTDIAADIYRASGDIFKGSRSGGFSAPPIQAPAPIQQQKRDSSLSLGLSDMESSDPFASLNKTHNKTGWGWLADDSALIEKASSRNKNWQQNRDNNRTTGRLLLNKDDPLGNLYTPSSQSDDASFFSRRNRHW